MVIGAHSSMAEQPAHNRSGLGSSPGGPTIVSERLHGLTRGWAAMESGGSVVSERWHGLTRGWAAIERGGSAGPVYRFDLPFYRLDPPVHRSEPADSSFERPVFRLPVGPPVLRSFPRAFVRALARSPGRSLAPSRLRFGTPVEHHVMNDTMESTWILNCKH